MKRKNGSITPARASLRRSNKAKGRVDELYPYFDNLPSHIIAHMLLHLPIKSLLICECVCKIWKTLISEPHFAKLNFERSQVCLMIRIDDCRLVSRTMYLLECDPEKFQIGSNSRVKLAPIFKLPLRNANSYKEKIENKPKCPIRAMRLVLEKNGENRRPLVICNPVTGEFIRLPKATANLIHNDIVDKVSGIAAFGFQPKTNEYKVMYIWDKYVRRGNGWVFDHIVLEINTLGTPSWRNAEVDPQISIGSGLSLHYPTYVNGALHWIRFEDEERSILCFCFESERLQSFPSPPVFQNQNNGFRRNERIRMGELRGLLYICDTYSFRDVAMWVMNEYDIGESWTKVYNIDTLISPLGRPDSQRYGLCWPVKNFEEGAAILLYHSCNCLIYYEPKKHAFKVFRIHGISSEFVEIIPHVPSLISLKDVVKGDNTEMLNIHSRCANVKLEEENEVLSLSQQVL
ncbi:F-box protein interaction domain protein [Medicago truncatula]|uniref:F-box protein interaction domain protein n=1 Tax=Medicago truncatula TaxID=3880 RepID=A0A072UDQ6_MEDTR|nr:F-box protein interaction domain protein [Medicago truncatula]